MDKQIGKLYSHSYKERKNGKLKIYHTIVMCTTGFNTNLNTFSGVVVKQTNNTSDHRVGDFSNGWVSSVFIEYNKPVKLSNID